MIVDVCLYAGEVDMLELRLRTLAPVVDHFVVLTCELTHQGERAEIPMIPGGYGLPVPTVYEVHPRVRLPQGERGGAGSPHYQQIEREHRDGALAAAHQVTNDPAAFVMVSDVDEIPSPETVADFPILLTFPRPPRRSWHVLQQRFHSTALDLLHPQQPWYGTCVSRLRDLAPQEMRDARTTVGGDLEAIEPIAHGGWHLSWMGTDDERQRKLDTFSHAELRGRFDVIAARRALRHANGEPLRRLTLQEMELLSWPQPILDGTFTIPKAWL